MARLAAAADVVAVPSVHDDAGNVDGLPNFALEALATGTPVVATNVGGLPQLIEDGQTGLLVPERDAAALAAAIGALLADPPERGRRARRGQPRAAARAAELRLVRSRARRSNSTARLHTSGSGCRAAESRQRARPAGH